MNDNQPIEIWITRLGEVLGEITGSHPEIRRTAPGEGDAGGGPLLWWRCSAPAIYIGVTEADAALLLNMRRQDLEGERPDSARAGLSEILDRSWGRGEICAQSPAHVVSREIYQAEFPTGGSMSFVVVQAEATSQAESNLEMLMDIELPITLRFGSTQMALRDIAGLSAGSIIEFDRGIDEPVDVMVNGHIVARGEAVVVQGSYGVRISEIASRRERLLTAKAGEQSV